MGLGRNSSGGGGSGLTFKKTLHRGGSDLAYAGTSYADIDAGFPALSLTLAVGDVVEMEFSATFGNTATGNIIHIDWLIDQPTSGDTAIRTVNGGAAAGVIELGTNATDANFKTVKGVFTATEAGVHTFKPQWKSNSGSASCKVIFVGTYGCVGTHLVKNIGQAAA